MDWSGDICGGGGFGDEFAGARAASGDCGGGEEGLAGDVGPAKSLARWEKR